MPSGRDHDRVGVPEAADRARVEAGLDREHHADVDDREVAEVEERRLVVAKADRMAGVLTPVGQQVVLLEVAHDGAVDVGAGDAGAECVEGGLLRGHGVVEEAAHLVGRRPDDHRALELGVVAPDRGARLGDEHVAGLELDVVRDRVRPGAAQPDLPPVAGRDAVGRGLLLAVARRRASAAARASPRAPPAGSPRPR